MWCILALSVISFGFVSSNAVMYIDNIAYTNYSFPNYQFRTPDNYVIWVFPHHWCIFNTSEVEQLRNEVTNFQPVADVSTITLPPFDIVGGVPSTNEVVGVQWALNASTVVLNQYYYSWPSLLQGALVLTRQEVRFNYSEVVTERPFFYGYESINIWIREEYFVLIGPLSYHGGRILMFTIRYLGIGEYGEQHLGHSSGKTDIPQYWEWPTRNVQLYLNRGLVLCDGNSTAERLELLWTFHFGYTLVYKLTGCSDIRFMQGKRSVTPYGVDQPICAAAIGRDLYLHIPVRGSMHNTEHNPEIELIHPYTETVPAGWSALQLTYWQIQRADVLWIGGRLPLVPQQHLGAQNPLFPYDVKDCQTVQRPGGSSKLLFLLHLQQPTTRSTSLNLSAPTPRNSTIMFVFASPFHLLHKSVPPVTEVGVPMYAARFPSRLVTTSNGISTNVHMDAFLFPIKFQDTLSSRNAEYGYVTPVGGWGNSTRTQFPAIIFTKPGIFPLLLVSTTHGYMSNSTVTVRDAASPIIFNCDEQFHLPDNLTESLFKAEDPAWKIWLQSQLNYTDDGFPQHALHVTFKRQRILTTNVTVIVRIVDGNSNEVECIVSLSFQPVARPYAKGQNVFMPPSSPLSQQFKLSKMFIISVCISAVLLCVAIIATTMCYVDYIRKKRTLKTKAKIALYSFTTHTNNQLNILLSSEVIGYGGQAIVVKAMEATTGALLAVKISRDAFSSVIADLSIVDPCTEKNGDTFRSSARRWTQSWSSRANGSIENDPTRSRGGSGTQPPTGSSTSTASHPSTKSLLPVTVNPEQIGGAVELERQEAEREKLRSREIAQQEYNLLHYSQHENIVPVYGYIKEHCMIIMEYMSGGSLQALLDDVHTIAIGSVIQYCKEILTGLSWLHHNEIIHRDLKPGNILLDGSGACHISDFGCAKDTNELTASRSKDQVIGTFRYIPPELFDNKPWSTKGDIWAFGLLALYMATGTEPWPEASTLIDIMSCVSNSNLSSSEEMEAYYPIHKHLHEWVPTQGTTNISHSSTAVCGTEGSLPSTTALTNNSKKSNGGYDSCSTATTDTVLSDARLVKDRHRRPHDDATESMKTLKNELTHFLQCCLTVNPDKRSTSKALLKHKFLRNHHFVHLSSPVTATVTQTTTTLTNTPSINMFPPIQSSP